MLLWRFQSCQSLKVISTRCIQVRSGRTEKYLYCITKVNRILAFTTAYAISWAYAFSLQVWVSVWISSSFIAWWTIRKRQIKLHKEWMTRSYIVTLAFVISGLTARLPVVQSLGSFADFSPSLFWMGWAVPLYIYEVVLSLRQKRAGRI